MSDGHCHSWWAPRVWPPPGDKAAADPWFTSAGGCAVGVHDKPRASHQPSHQPTKFRYITLFALAAGQPWTSHFTSTRGILPQYEIRNTKNPRNVLNTSEVHEQIQTSPMPRDADMFMSPDKGFEEFRRAQGAPPMQPDIAHDASGVEPSSTPVSRPRLRPPRPWQLSRNRNGYPPNSFITMADKRHALSAVYVGFPSVGSP